MKVQVEEIHHIWTRIWGPNEMKPCVKPEKSDAL